MSNKLIICLSQSLWPLCSQKKKSTTLHTQQFIYVELDIMFKMLYASQFDIDMLIIIYILHIIFIYLFMHICILIL